MKSKLNARNLFNFKLILGIGFIMYLKHYAMLLILQFSLNEPDNEQLS